MIHPAQHFSTLPTSPHHLWLQAGRPEQLAAAVQLRGPADDVLPEDGDEGNPGSRLPVGARLALRHCRLGPSGDGERWGKMDGGMDGGRVRVLGKGRHFEK